MLGLPRPGHSPEQAGQRDPHPGWPAAERDSRLRAVRAWRGALGPGRAQCAFHGMAGGGSPAAKPWQGVHYKLPQPTVKSLDMVESPSS
jgi:hypothetical protein